MWKPRPDGAKCYRHNCVADARWAVEWKYGDREAVCGLHAQQTTDRCPEVGRIVPLR